MLGAVGRPHGLGGDFFVAGRDEPIPLSYREILIGAAPGVSRAATLGASRRQGDRIVARCSLAATRAEAQALTGQQIFVAAPRARAVARGAWLWGDLDGVEIVAADGVRLGVVRHVYNAGASDVVEVESDAGRRADLPLVADYFDMGAPLAGGRLVLKVEAAVFAGLWSDP